MSAPPPLPPKLPPAAPAAAKSEEEVDVLPPPLPVPSAEEVSGGREQAVVVGLKELNKSLSKEAFLEVLASTVALLESEWPTSNPSLRVANLRSMLGPRLPAGSVLRWQPTGAILGFGSISAVDKGVTLYSVVIASELRGCGLGRVLMSGLEELAKSARAGYMHLFTNNAAPFYAKLGYMPSTPVSSLKANASRLNSDQLAGLEAALARKVAATQEASAGSGALPEGDANASGTVWMKKRLGYWNKAMRPSGSAWSSAGGVLRRLMPHVDMKYEKWSGIIASAPWMEQLGPSCGVAAAELAASMWTEVRRDGDGARWSSWKATLDVQGENFELGDVVDHVRVTEGPEDRGSVTRNGWDWTPKFKGNMQGIFDALIGAKLTIDGELFDAPALAAFLKEWYGHSGVSLMSKVTGETLKAALDSQCVVLFPYDRESAGNGVELKEGRSAHWGLLVGYAHPEEAPHDTLLVCTHSMSTMHTIAPSDVWVASNAQLDKVAMTDLGVAHTVTRDHPTLAGHAISIPLP